MDQSAHGQTVDGKDDDDALRAQQHSIRNRAEIEQSSRCGCFHCGQTFRPGAIVAWRTDHPGASRGDTARCPQCGIDAVLGDASGLPLTGDFLRRAGRHWFRR